MKLASLKVRHYKSLSKVTLDNLGAVTVLVGPNGVGKSNVVDTLRFLRDGIVEGLEHAISKRDGIVAIRQYSPTKPFQITFQLEFTDSHEASTEVENASQHELSTYDLTLSSLVGGNYKVESESATWFDSDGYYDEEAEQWVAEESIPHTFDRDATGKIRLDGIVLDRTRFSQDALALGKDIFAVDFHGTLGGELSRFLSNCRFAAIYPNTLREPHRPDTDRLLKETGENWASILRSLRKTSRGKLALDRLREIMQAVNPAFVDVSVNTVGGFLVPQFRFKESKSTKPHGFDASQLSDGTLRLFGTLLALYTVPPPPFMAIEEPEQTIHPGLLATLSEVFADVSSRTQLILTTHSPHLVDFFQPEDIRVVSMMGGLTTVAPVRKSQIESVKERLMTLGEFMMSEGLAGAP